MVETAARRSSISMRARKVCGIAIVVWVAGILFASQTQTKPPDCESPIWSAEVLAEPKPARRSARRLPNINHAGVVFLNDEKIIVYEVEHDASDSSSRTALQDLNPFSLRLSLMDSTSGKLELSKQQRTRDQDAVVFVTVGGVLVQTGGRLKLYSPDLAQDRDVLFPLDRNSRFSLSVSASGKTIMLNEVLQDSSKYLYSHFEVLDAATLKVRYSWNESPPLYHHYSISDELIAAVDFSRHAIVVSDFGSRRWRIAGKESGICSGENIPKLYTNKELFYGCDGLVAISSDGHVVMTEAFPNSETSTTNAAVAQQRPVVAVSVNAVEAKRHLFAESRAIITAVHILVYDLAAKRRILIVNLQPLPSYDYDFALSPDGSKLAILNDRRVSVCSVPTQGAGPR